jgi:hypothetical protein
MSKFHSDIWVHNLMNSMLWNATEVTRKAFFFSRPSLPSPAQEDEKAAVTTPGRCAKAAYALKERNPQPDVEKDQLAQSPDGEISGGGLNFARTFSKR